MKDQLKFQREKRQKRKQLMIRVDFRFPSKEKRGLLLLLHLRREVWSAELNYMQFEKPTNNNIRRILELDEMISGNYLLGRLFMFNISIFLLLPRR